MKPQELLNLDYVGEIYSPGDTHDAYGRAPAARIRQSSDGRSIVPQVPNPTRFTSKHPLLSPSRLIKGTVKPPVLFCTLDEAQKGLARLALHRETSTFTAKSCKNPYFQPKSAKISSSSPLRVHVIANSTAPGALQPARRCRQPSGRSAGIPLHRG